MTNKTKKIKTKSIEIDRSLCIKLFTNIKSFGPSLLRPPLCGPSLLSAPAELVLSISAIYFIYLVYQNRKMFSFKRSKIHKIKDKIHITGALTNPKKLTLKNT